MQTLHMNKGAGDTSYAKNSTVQVRSTAFMLVIYFIFFIWKKIKFVVTCFVQFLQSKIISIAKPVIEEALVKTLSTKIPESMSIADLGCSSGPNSLSVIWQIVDAIHAKCCTLDSSPPELRLFLNDLFGNDFNNVFASLPTFYNQIKEEKGLEFGPCFVLGVPGSFYGRLFPRNSLHFIHSSSSLHWLSQVIMTY